MAFALIPPKVFSNLLSPSPHRYANTRHPAVRYSAYVRQRPPLVLLCLLHLWDCRCAALGRAAEKQVFPRQEFCNVSTIKKEILIFFSSFLLLPCRRNPSRVTSARVDPAASRLRAQRGRGAKLQWQLLTGLSS